MADLQLDAYRDAAKTAAVQAPSSADATKEITAGKDKIRGLTDQMKEVGRTIVDAEADIAASQTARDPAAEALAQGRLNTALELLKQNFELRKRTVARLRTLGESVTDPYVP